MTISTLAKGLAGALTASAIYAVTAASAAATTLTLIDPPTQTNTPETVTFTATGTEALVIDEGYQVNDLETLANNAVTLSGGGPNLLGSIWQMRFAALGSNSYTFNDGGRFPGSASPRKIHRTWTRFTSYSRRFRARVTLTASLTRTTLRVSARRLRCLSPRPAAFRRPRPGPCCFSAS
jgi:hypothetical protein